MMHAFFGNSGKVVAAALLLTMMTHPADIVAMLSNAAGSGEKVCCRISSAKQSTLPILMLASSDDCLPLALASDPLSGKRARSKEGGANLNMPQKALPG
jgi:hypothetical protein